MALGAMANNPGLRVKIVPVGLSYFHAHKFRSRGVVEFGTAFDVPEEYVEMFKEGGAKKREAVQGFLGVIYDALKTVTVRAPDYDTLMLIQGIRRLYKTPYEHPTLGQVVEMNRRLLEGYQVFKDEPKVVQLRNDVLKYNRMLRDLGLRDHQVMRAQKAGLATAGLLGYRFGLLVVWTLLALPGTVLNAPLLILARRLAKKKARGMYSLCHRRIVTDKYYRSPGSIDCKDRRTGCAGDVEGAHLDGCGARIVQFLCCGRNNTGHPCSSTFQVPRHDAFRRSCCLALHDILRIEVRRGRYGCSQVCIYNSLLVQSPD